jgi:hypothetical protein
MTLALFVVTTSVLTAAACAADRPPGPRTAGDGPPAASHPCTDRACLEPAVHTLAASGIGFRAGVDITASERLAFAAARPVFERYCLRCHTQGSKKVKPATLAALDMTTYPFTGRHGDALAAQIRTVVGLDGSSPRMPMVKPGCLSRSDLDHIAAWARAFDEARATVR